jgi:hypothetical protein
VSAPAELLPTLERLGGFSRISAAPPPDSDAVPWAQALAPAPLQARFDAVRRALATGSGLPVEDVDPRVAVSATQVGLASRLWSVSLSSAALLGWVPDLRTANLVASPGHRGPVPLGLRDPDAGYAVASPAEAAAVIAEVVLEGSLADLDDACARVGRTAPLVLVSNAASSLVGAARVLAGHRPEAGGPAWALVRALVGHPVLAQGGRLHRAEDLPAGVGGPVERPGEVLVRTGCCVFYRLPGHGLCPDCVLAPRHPDRVTAAH